jgi:hypothetical protein
LGVSVGIGVSVGVFAIDVNVDSNSKTREVVSSTVYVSVGISTLEVIVGLGDTSFVEL